MLAGMEQGAGDSLVAKWSRKLPGIYAGHDLAGNQVAEVYRQGNGRWAVHGYGARTFRTLKEAQRAAEQMTGAR